MHLVVLLFFRYFCELNGGIHVIILIHVISCKGYKIVVTGLDNTKKTKTLANYTWQVLWIAIPQKSHY